MFGSPNPFGQPSTATPFGTQTQPLFGQPSNTSPFGSQTQPLFGQPSNNSPFGSQTQSPFGQPSNNSPFGSQTQSPFGQTNNANTNPFGTSNPFGAQTGTSMFGNNSTGVFGQPQASSSPSGFSSLFGNTTQQSQLGNNPFASSTPFSNNMFGTRSAFSASSNPAFGPSSTSSFNFGSSPAFAQSTSAFSSTPSPFAVPQAPSTGSRVTPYVPTTTEDTVNNKVETLQSISGMNVYKDKSHEELKFEDYQKGDKGGPLSTGFNVTNSQPSTMFGQPQPSANPPNPFANSAATNPFSQTPATSNFSSPFRPSPFAQSTSSTTTNAFGPSPNPAFPSFPSTNPNPFASSGSSFTTTPSSSNPPAFPSFPSTTTNPSGSSFASSSNPAFPSFPSTTTNPFPSSGSSFTTTPSQSLFASPSTSFAPSSSSAFNFSPSTFSSTPGNVSTPALSTGFNFNNSQSPSLFNSNPATGQNTNPGFSFTTSSTGMGSLFSTTSSSTTSTTTPFSQNPPAWPTLNLSPQPPQQVANPTSFSNGMGSFSQVPASTNSVVMQQPIIVTNPFGTLPALPQISFDQGRNLPSYQYGISSRPVVDTPASVRISPLLTCRNILQRRVGAPLRKYRPGDDAAPKVPFFNAEEYSKSYHYFIPRENPRALLIRPVEKENLAPAKENGKTLNEETNGANNETKSDGEIGEAPLELNVTHENHKNSSPSNAEIESLMPKLHHAEYYTEPRIQELAAKERADPGYCGRVRDFVVGRNGYGNIKFLGETDVRKLELETLVQFNNREVLVYMDESTKPPVGEGLNKPAEVTLLNIKCYEKKSGKQVKEGSRVDKYKELLKRKGQEQGAEFVSYEAVNGEWKFRVEHF